MSHTVTVTRTMTTSSTSAILLNVGYFKKPPGILKLLHVILGIVTVGLLGHYIGYYYSGSGYVYVNASPLFIPELFFLLISTTCLISSTLLLFSCFVSIATATILPKTIFEILFHGFATIFLLTSGILYILRLQDLYGRHYYSYNPRLSAGVIGIVNAILYGVATYFSYRQYKNV